MTDIRTRLADALRQHYFWWPNHSSIGMQAHCQCGERPRDWSYWADHGADVLLSLPGIAIVELPATFINQTKFNKVRDELKWIHKGLEDARQWRDWEEVARLRRRVSHTAALLAAANAAQAAR
jgi:hypothetical protein